MTPSPLLVLGPISDSCGYGHHTRQLVLELVRLGIDVSWLRIPWAQLIPKEEFPEELASREGRCVSDIALQFCMPDQMVTSVRPDARHVNHTMFEASRIPQAWVERARHLPLTLVPTAFGQRLWIESGAPDARVKVSPLGVDVDVFRPDVGPLGLVATQGRPLSQFQHRFLNVSELTERKNIAGLIRAWKAALRPSDDAVLIVKVSGATPEQLQQLARDTGDLSSAPTVVMTNRLTSAQMPKLFAAATCYVSASRGEGWDLPMLEAASTGLSLIAPKHSAYVDYLDDSVAQLVPAKTMPINQAAIALPRLLGASWWEPDFDDLVFAMRQVLDGRANQSDVRKRVAMPRTWKHAGQALLAHLKALS